MLEAIMETLKIMCWLGVVLGILVVVNITSKTIYNVWSSKELFSWRKMLKGIGKSLVFYLSAVAISIACTILPYVNEMITASFGVMLVSNETLEVLSSVGILGIVMTTVVTQAKKAISGVATLSSVSTNDEEISWTVEEE